MVESMEGKNEKTLYKVLNELTMQIIADRYNVKLKIKEKYKNNKERTIKINCK